MQGRGTNGSNPLPSSKESANFQFLSGVRGSMGRGPISAPKIGHTVEPGIGDIQLGIARFRHRQHLGQIETGVAAS